MRELILGGSKSGKSRTAEARAAAWLKTPRHSAALIATALAGDDEMRTRIARHQYDRALRAPQLSTLEEPLAIAEFITTHSGPLKLLIVDCLTLWLTHLLLPIDGIGVTDEECETRQIELCDAITQSVGQIVLVSNEISLGVTPMSAEARRFLDHHGLLHQRLANLCDRVTLMVAGIEVNIKGAVQ
jgi:adenosylcobinamide kinase / adenosylcobinamide-phosphate guanylyltransferase